MVYDAEPARGLGGRDAVEVIGVDIGALRFNGAYLCYVVEILEIIVDDSLHQGD